MIDDHRFSDTLHEATQHWAGPSFTGEQVVAAGRRVRRRRHAAGAIALVAIASTAAATMLPQHWNRDGNGRSHQSSVVLPANPTAATTPDFLVDRRTIRPAHGTPVTPKLGPTFLINNAVRLTDGGWMVMYGTDYTYAKGGYVAAVDESGAVRKLGRFRQVQASPDGRTIAAVPYQATRQVILYDLASMAEIAKVTLPAGGKFDLGSRVVGFSGDWLVISQFGRYGHAAPIDLWNWRTGAERRDSRLGWLDRVPSGGAMVFGVKPATGPSCIETVPVEKFLQGMSGSRVCDGSLADPFLNPDSAPDGSWVLVGGQTAQSGGVAYNDIWLSASDVQAGRFTPHAVSERASGSTWTGPHSYLHRHEKGWMKCGLPQTCTSTGFPTEDTPVSIAGEPLLALDRFANPD